MSHTILAKVSSDIMDIHNEIIPVNMNSFPPTPPPPSPKKKKKNITNYTLTISSVLLTPNNYEWVRAHIITT